MNVRIVDHAGELIATGVLDRAWRHSSRSDSRRDVMRVDGERGRAEKGEPAWGNCVVLFATKVKLPLWYGGLSTDSTIEYFSLPSGLQNIWGCGNDFDSDAVRIHPDDLQAVIERAT